MSLRCRRAMLLIGGPLAVIASPTTSLVAQLQSPPGRCNQAMPNTITHLPIPDHPIDPIPTRDGCWVFLTVLHDSTPGGIAVLRRSAGTLVLTRFVVVDGGVFGAALTHDEKLLAVTAGRRVVFLDVATLESDRGEPVVGSIRDSTFIGSDLLSVSADDNFLFVTQERSATISVINLQQARASGFGSSAIVGGIRTGRSPVSLAFSPDGEYLYATSQGSPDGATWPIDCRPEANRTSPPDHTQGTLMVIDAKRAELHPEGSLIASTRAGCNPVRVVLSPDGRTAYVTARGNDALVALDTRKILTDTAHAIIGSVPVGTAPVGLVTIDNGRRIVVTNSSRFAGSQADHQELTVIDARRISVGASAVLGNVSAGGFPRQLHVTADGRTLFVSNYNTGTLEIVDLGRLQLRPVARQGRSN